MPRIKEIPGQVSIFPNEKEVRVAEHMVQTVIANSKGNPSAEFEHRPNPDKAERARKLRGVGNYESDRIGGLEEPKFEGRTPGITPSKIRRATEAADKVLRPRRARTNAEWRSKDVGQKKIEEQMKRDKVDREAHPEDYK